MFEFVLGVAKFLLTVSFWFLRLLDNSEFLCSLQRFLKITVTRVFIQFRLYSWIEKSLDKPVSHIALFFMDWYLRIGDICEMSYSSSNSLRSFFSHCLTALSLDRVAPLTATLLHFRVRDFKVFVKPWGITIRFILVGAFRTKCKDYSIDFFLFLKRPTKQKTKKC